MNSLAKYNNVVEDVAKELSVCMERTSQHGIPRWMCVVDPGIGFAKSFDHNIEVLKNLKQFRKHVHDLPVYFMCMFGVLYRFLY